jgi:hypothetical protein
LLKTRRPRCRYGALSLLGCLLAIAIPREAWAQTCDITAVPPGPVKPGALAEFSSGCTGAPTSIEWSSCLANCAPSAGPVTVCNFPSSGTSVITANAAYSDGFGGSFYASDSYPMQVSSAAAPSCYITASPGGPVQPGAWADFAAHCTGNPSFISWSGSFSGFATCEPIIGPSTSCNFPNLGTTVILAKANYGGNFAGCFATDTYAMAVTPSAAPNCNIGMSPQGPLQPGAWADVFARCSGIPDSIQWASSLANCAPLTGAQTVCNFPAPGVASLDVSATYAGSFGNFVTGDHLPVLVSTSARQTCSISANPASPVRVGDTSRLAANCTGAPLVIAWSSCFANCGAATGPAIDCVFPTVGNSPFFVQAEYAGCIATADTFLMHVNVPLSACTYSVAPSDLANIGIAGGRHTVIVGTPEGCPVTATLFQPWIRIASIVPGTSTATVTIDVDFNNGPSRATSIVLAGRLFLITQLGQ